jgi:predicted glycoside hydrolase/deacetylase ChbG (UPF0249 family)
MRQTRALVVVADDFGFGPATTRGILELAQRGLVTGSVLMVNSPYAEASVAHWRKAGEPMELGWHPTLTSDTPILPASRVPSLVDKDGKFWTLGRLVKRLFLGRIVSSELEVELRAQYNRFRDLVGHPATLVNSHQHVSLFQPVGFILLHVLAQRRPLPYVRCVREPWRMLWRIPGARCKRSFLSFLGKPLAKKQQALGFLGNDWLAGITDPRWVRNPQFLVRWLSRIPGDIVELACHPGYYDATLIGRDCTANDGLLQRRVDELGLLNHPSFVEACEAAGFTRMQPSALSLFSGTYKAYAA